LLGDEQIPEELVSSERRPTPDARAGVLRLQKSVAVFVEWQIAPEIAHFPPQQTGLSCFGRTLLPSDMPRQVCTSGAQFR
jgi:hypothetical protein